MQVTARVDYAMRAMLELAASSERSSRDTIAAAQGIPPRYLEEILGQLRQAGLVSAMRGSSGGFILARSPAAITVADVSRAVDGPLTLVQGQRPEAVRYEGASQHLQELWVALRASVREVMEGVTLEDLVSGSLPAQLRDMLAEQDAWLGR